MTKNLMQPSLIHGSAYIHVYMVKNTFRPRRNQRAWAALEGGFEVAAADPPETLEELQAELKSFREVETLRRDRVKPARFGLAAMAACSAAASPQLPVRK